MSCPLKFPSAIIEDSKKFRTVDYSKFSIVKETLYSSVRPYHFLQIGGILKRVFKKPKLIIDTCAHIGGSTINMAHVFPSTQFVSIELKKSVYNVLCKNIVTFGYQKKVMAVNENCIPFLKKMTSRTKPDFINFDPPWGGPKYTKVKKLMLCLNNTTGRSVPLYDIINDVFSRNTTNFVTFKAPNNFDMDLFNKHIKGTVRIYPIYNTPLPPVKKLSKKGKSPKQSTKKITKTAKSSTKKVKARRTVYYYIIVKKQ